MNEELSALKIAIAQKIIAGNHIFSDLKMNLNFGEIVALLGPSGCGKTTLLRMICGLEESNQEEILFANNADENIGYIFQKPILYPHLNVGRNVELGIAGKLSKEEKRRLVNEELKFVGLEGFYQRKIDSLSGGEAQRVAIARALLAKPSLLLMDEPFSSLDLKTKTRITSEVRELLKQKNIPCIHVTHDPDEADIIADRVLSWSEITQ